MGLHEYLLLGLLVIAVVVVLVEVRRSKKPADPEPDPGAAPVEPPEALPPLRHVVLVGHDPVTRLSLRRALETQLSVTEARDATEGMARLGALVSPETQLLAVVDVGDHEEFIAGVRSDPTLAGTRILALVPAAPAAPTPDANGDRASVEYLAKPVETQHLLNRIRSLAH